ncbi:MAG: PLDc N-terminal domain-containing protein [Nesterenkonia sp.]|nr:PLDc N-terminal domain-containing protein [Nesterenkonia sp.]
MTAAEILLSSAGLGGPWGFWGWAFGTVTVGLIVAALMVLVQTSDHSLRQGLAWIAAIFFLPILGATAYLIWETVRYHRGRSHGTR